MFFVCVQAAFPNDDTYPFLYISYVCFLPDDQEGLEHVGDYSCLKW